MINTKTDPKAVWSCIKSKTKLVQGVPDLYTDNTKTTKSKTEAKGSNFI